MEKLPVRVQEWINQMPKQTYPHGYNQQFFIDLYRDAVEPKVKGFIERMSQPPARGKNKGKPRSIENVRECAHAAFSGYTDRNRGWLTEMLYLAYLSQ